MTELAKPLWAAIIGVVKTLFYYSINRRNPDMMNKNFLLLFLTAASALQATEPQAKPKTGFIAKLKKHGVTIGASVVAVAAVVAAGLGINYGRKATAFERQANAFIKNSVNPQTTAVQKAEMALNLAEAATSSTQIFALSDVLSNAGDAAVAASNAGDAVIKLQAALKVGAAGANCYADVASAAARNARDAARNASDAASAAARDAARDAASNDSDAARDAARTGIAAFNAARAADAAARDAAFLTRLRENQQVFENCATAARNCMLAVLRLNLERAKARAAEQVQQ